MTAGNEINAKCKELELIAYGCHKRTFNTIHKALYDCGINSFSFFEYFSTEPYLIKSDSDISILCPFVKRYLMNLPLLPDKIITCKEKDEIFFYSMRKPRNENFLKELYDPKILKLKKTDHYDTIKILNELKKDGSNNCFPFSKTMQDLSEYLSNKDNDIEKIAVTISWWEYLKNSSKDSTVNFIYFPICTEKIFYGVLLLIIPNQSDMMEKVTRVCEEISVIAEEEYLSLLILFHNYWQELRLNIALDPLNDVQKNVIISQYLDILKENGSELECIFHNIWIWRKNLPPEALKKSLIMTKYLVASPGMIQIVNEALTINPKDDYKKSKELPCVLVVGGPGSGKDSMAKLIMYFSEFREGELITINMASIQPEMLSVPLLFGAQSSPIIDFNGLLQKALEKEKAKPLILVFDELNSLPVEIQGALLRFIENREITPTGSIDDCHTEKERKILLIGVMNEDPEQLTKNSTLRKILSDKQIFGGTFGEIIYEYIRNSRRLREDLYYRMKRTAMINIPELQNRREDIPFLFYVFIKDEIKKEIGHNADDVIDRLIIEYESLDALMDKSLEWPGNIRQLQATCKAVFRKINLLETGPIIINRFQIEEALSSN